METIEKTLLPYMDAAEDLAAFLAEDDNFSGLFGRQPTAIFTPAGTTGFRLDYWTPEIVTLEEAIMTKPQLALISGAWVKHPDCTESLAVFLEPNDADGTTMLLWGQMNSGPALPETVVASPADMRSAIVRFVAASIKSSRDNNEVVFAPFIAAAQDAAGALAAHPNFAATFGEAPVVRFSRHGSPGPELRFLGVYVPLGIEDTPREKPRLSLMAGGWDARQDCADRLAVFIDPAEQPGMMQVSVWTADREKVGRAVVSSSQEMRDFVTSYVGTTLLAEPREPQPVNSMQMT